MGGGRIVEGPILHPFLKPLEIQGTIYNNVGEDILMDITPPHSSDHDGNERKGEKN